MGMTEQLSRRAQRKKSGRLAHFKATAKFQHEREGYYATTLGNAWSGFGRTVAANSKIRRSGRSRLRSTVAIPMHRSPA
jgi:hypothetical protein